MSKNPLDLQAIIDKAVRNEDVDRLEKILRDFFEPAKKNPQPFSPTLSFKHCAAQFTKTEPERFERPLDWANKICRAIRDIRYRRKIRDGFDGVRIVSEGDSWFQYPILLSDIIDNLSLDDDKAIRSFGAAGDTISGIAKHGEHLEAIGEEKADVFLLSAGGNDLLGNGALKQYLRRYEDGRAAGALLKRAVFEKKLSKILADTRHVVGEVVRCYPDVKIFCHGYDVPYPIQKGRWLGKPMHAKDIPLAVGREILHILLNEFNLGLAAIAKEFEQLTHINLLGVVNRGPHSWKDELHPKDAGYKRATDEFRKHINDRIKKPTSLKHYTSSQAPGNITRPLSRSQDDLFDASAAQSFDVSGAVVSEQNRLESELNQYLNESGTRKGRSGNREALNVRTAQIFSTRLGAMPSDIFAHEAPLPLDDDTARSIRNVLELIRDADAQDNVERRRTRRQIIPASDPHAADRITGGSNLYPASYLSKGLRAVNTVCRIHVGTPYGTVERYGTGLVVAPGLLLTNHHILADAEQAANSYALFQHEPDEGGQPLSSHTYRITPELFLTSRELDFSFATLSPHSAQGFALGHFGFAPLIDSSGKAVKGEKATIVHYGDGGRKEIALREAMILGVRENFIYYTTGTKYRSSGFPLFNDHWDVIGLHNMIVPHPTNRDSFLANQGIRISAIFAHLQQLDRQNHPVARAVLDQLQNAMKAKRETDWGPKSEPILCGTEMGQEAGSVDRAMEEDEGRGSVSDGEGMGDETFSGGPAIVQKEHLFEPDIQRPRLKRYKLHFPNKEAMRAATAMESATNSFEVINWKRNSVTIEASDMQTQEAITEATNTFAEKFGADVTPDTQFQLDTGTDIVSYEKPITRRGPTLHDVTRHINASRAWDRSTGRGVTIAVVDTGINGKRAEFSDSRRVGSWQTPGAVAWTDYEGHGTMCAVIAAGKRQGAKTYQGVAPGANLMACRTHFWDSELTMIYDILTTRAEAGEIIVTTNSFGNRTGTPPDKDDTLDLPAALSDAAAAGVHIFFSAGNNHQAAGRRSG